MIRKGFLAPDVATGGDRSSGAVLAGLFPTTDRSVCAGDLSMIEIGVTRHQCGASIVLRRE